MTQTSTANKAQQNAHSDARMDFLAENLKELPDNNYLIASRQSVVQAQTATLREVNADVEIPFRVGNARMDFGIFLDETLAPRESLNHEAFVYLLDEFLTDKFNGVDGSYTSLTSKQREELRNCIEACEDSYQQAFSDLLYDLSSTVITTPLEGMQTYSSMPSTLDQAYECYQRFFTDSEISPLLQGLDEAATFSAFQIARIARGVQESPVSRRAIAELEKFLELAA